MISEKNKNLKKNTLIDNFGRKLNYLRISVTERCNLRCTYCMPAEGIPHIDHEKILTYEEIISISKIFHDLGVFKFRFTGGEPFVRKGFINLLRNFRTELPNTSLHLTTNGVMLHKYIDELANLGVEGINLSLDSLIPEKFAQITRRYDFYDVKKSLELLMNYDFRIKINMVVQPGFNTDEITDIANLALNNNFEVRFIEQMKFNGTGGVGEIWDGKKILHVLEQNFANLVPVKKKGTTAVNYKSPEFSGTLGIINGHSRTFCNTCNRLRLTADGNMKTCLYDNGVLNLRDMLRNNQVGELVSAIKTVTKQRNKDGFETEANNKEMNDSMASIGG